MMKAENVQRKHLQQLRNLKAQESSPIASKPPGEKGRSARKSTNPVKAHSSLAVTTVTMDSEVQEDPRDISIVEDCMVSFAEKEHPTTSEEAESEDGVDLPIDTIVTENDSESDLKNGKTSEKTEDSSIDKVWETIRNDLSTPGDDEELDDAGEKEEGEVSGIDEEMLLLDDGPLVEEEEEPSDWEDREAGLADEIPEDPETESPSKKVVSECVTISSDDEGSPGKKVGGRKSSTPVKEAKLESDDEERLQLDSSSDFTDNLLQNESDTQEKIENEIEKSSNTEKDKIESELTGTLSSDEKPENSFNAEETAANSFEISDGSDQNTAAKESDVSKPVAMNCESGDLDPVRNEHDDIIDVEPEVSENLEHSDDDMANSEHGGDDMANSEHGDDDMANSEHGDDDMANSEHGDDDMANSEHGDDAMANSENGEDEMANSEHVDDEIANSEHGEEDMDNSDRANDISELVEGIDNERVSEQSTDLEKMDIESVTNDTDKDPESAISECGNGQLDVKEDNKVATEGDKSNDPFIVDDFDDDLIEIDSQKEKSNLELEKSEALNVSDPQESSDSLTKVLMSDDSSKTETTIKKPLENSGAEESTSDDSQVGKIQLEPTDVTDSKESETILGDKSLIEDDLDIRLVEEINRTKDKQDVSTEGSAGTAKIDQTENELENDSDKTLAADKLESRKIGSVNEGKKIPEPEIVEVDLDTDSDSHPDDKDGAFNKLLCSKTTAANRVSALEKLLCNNNSTAENESKNSKDDSEFDLLRKATELIGLDEPIAAESVDLDPVVVDVEPLQVDLDSQQQQCDPNPDQEMKEEERNKENMDSSPAKSLRKRHLSENAKAGPRTNVETTKRAKLDLTEEPLEDALKQLDALSKREKKPDDPPPRKLKLTKEILEELISRRITDYINSSQKSIIGQLKTRCDALEKGIDKWRRKAQGLQTIVNELTADLQKHQKKPRAPTRTVGINVRISTVDALRPFPSKVNQLPPKPPESSPVKTITITSPTPPGGPVPMQLVANTSLNPPKPTSTTPVNRSTVPIASQPSGSVNIIDLTDDDEAAALKANNRQQQQHTGNPTMSSSSTVLTTNTVTRTQGGMTIQTNTPILQPSPASPLIQTSTANPLIGMQMPLTMQLIPTVPNSGVTLRGPRPVGLQPNLNHPGSRVTTYLVPSGPNAMGQPRQLVTFPNSQMMQGARPGAPLQTFLLRMNTVPQPVVSSMANTYATISPVTSPMNTMSQIRGPPNVTMTTRNAIPTSVNIGQPTMINSATSITMVAKPRPINPSPANTTVIPLPQRHPAPFPPQPTYAASPQMKALPPKAALKISKVANGIVLSWNLTMNSTHAGISKYQLFAYQEGTGPPLSTLWKKVGDVKALPLPMACTLTQFVEGNKYHFAVRAVDKHGRFGPFSEPTSILLPGK